MKNTNYWKIAAVVLTLVLIVEIGLLVEQQKNISYNFGKGFESVKQTDLAELSKIHNGQPFKLCSTQEARCLIVGKLG